MQVWDIFCRVVDNYGDAGVTWRLARQLAAEHGVAPRLFIDAPRALAHMCPAVDAALPVQKVEGVELRLWPQGDAAAGRAVGEKGGQREGAGEGVGEGAGGGAGGNEDGCGGEAVADVVIEAFACELPGAYVRAMAARAVKPVWLNLDYLSAEEWVEGVHGLASPHASLPLTKYFFFPGFTQATGGLLRERGLLDAHAAFQADAAAQDAYWRGLGVPGRAQSPTGELRLSLFAYENLALPALLAAWAQGPVPVRCLVPEGRVLPQVAEFFGMPDARAGSVMARGQLTAHVLPFTDQPGYDRLLWACDWNFVRGEDSFVRAQWAARPFVWQIYPQGDAAHHAKLMAFWRRYREGLAPAGAAPLEDWWRGWNGMAAADWAGGWRAMTGQGAVLAGHAQQWAHDAAAQRDLAAQLVEFAAKVAK